MFRLVRTLFLIGTLVFALGASAPPSRQVAASSFLNGPAVWQAKVAPQVLAQAAGGATEFLVVLKAQADLSAAQRLPTKAQKGEYVYQQLSQLAARTQKPAIAELKSLGASYQPFWVTNMIWVRGDAAIVQAMAQRADVAHLEANPWVQMDLSQPIQESTLQAPLATDSIQWNINNVNAPQVWAAGYNGQGVVIGGQDTGYQWDHEALKDQYRGWDGSTADHNYNWHDAIHQTNFTNPCGSNTLAPCDDYGHGTHTMGTMVGEDPAGDHQIGMAPGAQWIGCRNMNQGVGSPASYSECFQWFIAPTDLNGQNPRPDLAPDVINNSWSCTYSEGCTSWDTIQSVVDNTRAAGIVVVASAGNSGPSCNTVNDPPAMYASVFTVGATDNSNNIASFSSRGPGDGSNLLKPDVSAPGVSILSSTKGGGYGYLSGTSMASPHVAGLVALMLSADPLLRGNVDAIENIIRQSSVPLTTTIQDCGGVSGSQVPNNTYGYGRIDAWKAFTQLPHLLAVHESAPAFVTPGELITYTLTVTHSHPLSPTFNVKLSASIPVKTFFLRASGNYSITGGDLQWVFPQLGTYESQTVQYVVQAPNVYTSILSKYQVVSDEVPGPISGSPVTTTVGMRDFVPILVR